MVADRKGKREYISVRTADFPKDETYMPTSVKFSVGTNKRGDDSPASGGWPGRGFDIATEISDAGITGQTTEGMDPFTGTNAFLLSLDQGHFTLLGGNREYKPILSWDSEIEYPDSIGFFVSPGGLLEIEDIAIMFPASGYNLEDSEYADPDMLRSYLMRSSDPKEGIWKVYDRSLEENMLRMGGDYTLALIRDNGGYKGYYLDGAKTLPETWQAGMLKCRLTETGFPDIYDVEWIDATGETLTKDIKARYESPLFTITFPYQSSTLRLRKLPATRSAASAG